MRVLFYYPGIIGDKLSGSSLRPMKMLEAFKNSDVDLDVIEGKYSDRKRKIKSIKREILSGKKQIDLLYFESLSSPFFHTYRHFAGTTLPFLILIDVLFLVFCVRKKIKVVYYFRDIHWDFSESFGEGDISKAKLSFLRLLGRLELFLMKKVANKIYVPNGPFAHYIKAKFKVSAYPLPPGSDLELTRVSNGPVLKFTFVGGCGSLYDPALVFQVFSEFEEGKIFLEYCTRADEWIMNKYKYPNLNLNNLMITHKSGEQLHELYENADVALYLMPPSKYIQISMGVKSAEYIMAGKPIIAYEGTPVAMTIKKYDIGWVIPYEKAALKNLLDKLLINRNEIISKRDNLIKNRHHFTWGNVVKNVLEFDAS
ncbi:MAG: glycosyltransferase [Gammaproteobacteria bacterium]|nr:glycosyltransferase [Gammaproteobacteria bacterium]